MIQVIERHLSISDCFYDLPKGAEILCVKAPINTPIIYLKVDSEEREIEKRHIISLNTGWSIDFPSNSCKYIDSFSISDSRLVFHVFEILPKLKKG